MSSTDEPRRSPARGVRDRDRLLDVKEAGELLGMSPATMYGWAYRRRVPVVKLSGPRGPMRFRLSDLERFIARQTRPTVRDSIENL